jgi:PucR family transcriptional regulator, purine catabolism regulatory protein
MPLTLHEVLDLDVVRRGCPHVVAGAARLDVPVRWVHALELTDVGRLLRGGELVLSTGIALPDSPGDLAAYVDSLAAVGVAGLAVELGRRYTSALPAALVAAAQDRAVPLVELRREVAFIEITEAVHARIIDELLLSRAAATLALGRLLTSRAESLERQAHRTLISALIAGTGPSGPFGGAGASEAEAAARARAMGVELTGRDLVAVVVRLPDEELNEAGLPSGPGAPGDIGGPSGIGGRGGLGPGLGAPGAGGEQAAVLGVAEAVAGACRTTGVPALVGALDDVRAGALLSLPPGASDEEPLGVLARRLAAWHTARVTPPAAAGAAHPVVPRRPATRPVIGASRRAGSLREVTEAFREAREVADLAVRNPGETPARPFYRLPDLRLRGLLHLLRDDTRLRAFAERELGPLLSYDAEHGTTLVGDLAAFLDAGGNKALAAARAHLARPTFYQRLAVIERVLSVSLADPESRASLHVALLARQEGR